MPDIACMCSFDLVSGSSVLIHVGIACCCSIWLKVSLLYTFVSPCTHTCAGIVSYISFIHAIHVVGYHITLHCRSYLCSTHVHIFFWEARSPTYPGHRIYIASMHCTGTNIKSKCTLHSSCSRTKSWETRKLSFYNQPDDHGLWPSHQQQRRQLLPKHKLPNTIACTAALTLHNSTAGGHSQQDKEKDTLGHHPGCSFGDKGITVYCGFHSDWMVNYGAVVQ